MSRVVCLFFFFKVEGRIFFFNLFIFGCVGSSFRARAFSSCGKRGPLFFVASSLVAGHRLQMRRLSSCGSRA